jgi:hypothetical protein
MTHPVPPQQRVGAQEAPTVMATAEGVPEQLARPVYLPLVLQGQGTAPDIPVNAAATARYVRCDWNNFDVTDVTGEPRVARVAFEKGYTAQSGAPLNDIILAFGRQVEPANPNVDGWGVQLTPPGSYSPCIDDNGIRDRDWVISVAEAYVEGYLANPAHRSGRIAIGTNNANFPWDCNNLGETSDLWSQAGEEWRLMLDEIDVPSLRVDIIGANDVESWWSDTPSERFTAPDRTDLDGDGDVEEVLPWIACGKGTQNWFYGYQSIAPSVAVINFGSNAWIELQGRSDLSVDWSLQWTQQQIFEVNMLGVARSYPQIYCPDTEVSWITMANNFRDDVFFYGVTSENNGSTICGTGSFTWQESWSQLFDGLRVINLPTRLAPSVSSFCLRPLDDDGSMSCSR